MDVPTHGSSLVVDSPVRFEGQDICDVRTWFPFSAMLWMPVWLHHLQEDSLIRLASPHIGRQTLLAS